MRELINRQNTEAFKKTRYGLLGNIAANGCGLIAAYNVMNGNGVDISLDAVSRGLRRRLGMAVGLGRLGTNMFSIIAFLVKYFAVRARFLFLGKGRSSKERNAIIIMYYWFTGKRCGAHYIAGLRCEDGCFDIYNYSSIPPHVELGEFLVGMRKKHEYPLWLVDVGRKRG